MFEINEETKNAAIAAMREAIESCGEEVPYSDATLGVAFDAAVVEVKKQFGF